MHRLALTLLATLALALPATAAVRPMDPIDPATIPDSAYCQVDEHGHLIIDGERQRFWAVIGNFPYNPKFEGIDDAAERQRLIDQAYLQNRALVERFTDLGFNMSRFWRHSPGDYTAGDGSRSDVVDHFLACMKAAGFRIWYPGIAQTYATPEDVDLVDDPATAEAWVAGIEAIGNNGQLKRIVCKWDPRCAAAQVAGMRRKTDHVNQYTGLRVGDDPLYVTFELTNEDWFMSKMVGGQFRKLPQFFQDQLQARWIAFLRDKYGDESRLRGRWGFLLPGESLDAGNVKILPLRGKQQLDGASMDPQAKKQLEESGMADEHWDRDDFNRHRGADVLEFFVDLHVSHKKYLESELERMGRACELVPTALDTGIGYEIQSQWLHQNADVSVHDAYINGSPRNNPAEFNDRFPWMSGLEEAPRICHDVPWLEHNKVRNQPFMCYETQIQQPAKYRAEFPFRILALASIQDWDAICWHYWGAASDIGVDDRAFDRPLDYTTGGHPQGYHFTYDAVQAAAMRVAGLAFRGEAFEPAPQPATFVYGSRDLYDPASMDYAGSYGKMGLSMLPTTYQQGVRIEIDPTREDSEIVGTFVRYDAESKPTTISPNDQITFDTRRGGLTMDSPLGALFTGFMTRFGEAIRFDHAELVLSDVEIAIDPEMPYPEDIAEDRYLAFGLVSMDGKPLAETAQASLCLVSTSFNSGFALGRDHESGKNQAGSLPVRYARPSGTVTSPHLAGMDYVLHGWHMEELGRGTVGPDGRLVIPSDLPLWQVVLSR